MVEYEVVLKRHAGTCGQYVCIFIDEDKNKSISYMINYVKKNGFTITEKGNRYTIANVLLIETERISGKQPVSVTPYIEIYDDINNEIRKGVRLCGSIKDLKQKTTR